jgi:hypothetical protein
MNRFGIVALELDSELTAGSLAYPDFLAESTSSQKGLLL